MYSVLFLTIIFLSSCEDNGINDVVNCIIKDGSALMSSSSNHNNNIKGKIVPSSPFSGPESLMVLLNECFTTSHDKYEYRVCPFHNITQKRIVGNAWNLLGTYSNWFDNEGPDFKYRSTLYIGPQCGNDLNTSVVLEFVCSDISRDTIVQDYALAIIDDVLHCKYTMQLSVPLPCSLLDSNCNSFEINVDDYDTAAISTTNGWGIDSKDRDDGTLYPVPTSEAQDTYTSTEAAPLLPSEPTSSFISSNKCDRFDDLAIESIALRLARIEESLLVLTDAVRYSWRATGSFFDPAHGYSAGNDGMGNFDDFVDY